MAISAGSLIRVWSLRALDRLMFENPWMQVVDDRTAEAGGRRYFTLTDVKQEIRLNTRTTNSQDFGTARQPDSQDFGMDAHNHKYDWNEAVPILDEMETGPSLSASVDRWKTNRVVNQISADIRAKVDAATPRDTNELTIVAGADFLSAENLKKIVYEFAIRREFADAIGMPEGSRCAIISPKVRTALAVYLMDKGTDMSFGLARSTFLGMPVMQCHGWDILFDRSILGDFTTAGTKQSPMYFLQKNRTVPFFKQIHWSRVIVDQNAPQNKYQGLLHYDAIVPEEIDLGASAVDPDAYSDVTSGRYAESLMVSNFTVTSA